MNVLQYISELLYAHNCVIIPDFGGFIANQVSAGIHPVTHRFYPPRKEILFNSSLKTNDGLLANYMATKENISYEQAMQEIQSFVGESKVLLQNSEKLTVARVGVIFYDTTGTLQFNPDNDFNYLISSYGLPEFTSPAIQRENIEERIIAGFKEKQIPREEPVQRRKITRIAAISIPAAAVFIWGIFNFGPVMDDKGNYSNVFSFLTDHSNPAPTSVVAKHAPSTAAPFITDEGWYENGGLTLFNAKKQENTLYPAFTEFSIPEIAKDTVEVSVPLQTECTYYIIGSCNREKGNAVAYKARLRGKGYSGADIMEPENGGLYKVYISCFDSEEQANQALQDIHQHENADAWLLKK